MNEHDRPGPFSPYEHADAVAEGYRFSAKAHAREIGRLYEQIAEHGSMMRWCQSRAAAIESKLVEAARAHGVEYRWAMAPDDVTLIADADAKVSEALAHLGYTEGVTTTA